MPKNIPIDDRKDYTLSETFDLAIEVLQTLKEVIPQEDLIYPGREVFFTINDLVERFINPRINGELTMKQVKSREYRITYDAETHAYKRGRRQNLISVAKTAILLLQRTGKLPAYAQKEPYKEIVDGLLSGKHQEIPEKEVFIDPEDVSFEGVAHE